MTARYPNSEVSRYQYNWSAAYASDNLQKVGKTYRIWGRHGGY